MPHSNVYNLQQTEKFLLMIKTEAHFTWEILDTHANYLEYTKRYITQTRSERGCILIQVHKTTTQHT